MNSAEQRLEDMLQLFARMFLVLTTLESENAPQSEIEEARANVRECGELVEQCRKEVAENG